MLAKVTRGVVCEGDWLIAGVQTSGRGRMGRKWLSEKGNLFASTVIEVRTHDPVVTTLAAVAGIALIDAIALRAASLKWPNDVMIGARKCAGILLERSGDWVIAGFGVNIVQAPDVEDRETASLSEHGSEKTADELGKQLVETFAATLAEWRSTGFAAIRKRWEATGPSFDALLTVALPDGSTLAGCYAGLADDGGLKLLLADGRIDVVRAGDVAMVGEV